MPQSSNDNGFLQVLQRKLVGLIKKRSWSELLLLIVSTLFLGFGPSGLIIFSIIEAPPTWYWVAFWLIEGALFFVSVLLELRKRPADNAEDSRDNTKNGRKERFSQWMKFLGIFLVAVVLLLTWNSIFGSDSDPNQNDVLQCDIRNNKDCFSWGEDVLISKNPAFDGEEDWKKKCTDNWDFKKEGTIGYKQPSQGGFEQAARDFEKFVTRCPNDPEARIYLNNAKAERDGNPIRIAVSVPISRQSDSLSKQNEQKIKETSDFQQLLRGVALAQAQINNNGGIQYRKLLVGIVDDGYKIVSSDDDKTKINRGKMAENVANFLSKKTDIVGVIGHPSSDATKVAAKIYNEEKLVAVSPTSTAIKEPKKPEGFKLGEYVFRTVIHDGIATEKLAAKASDKKSIDIQRIAIVYDSIDEYSSSFKGGFQIKFVDLEGGDIVNDKVRDKDWCDISKNALYQTNPRECLNQAKQRNAQALLLVPSAAHVEDIETLIKFNSQEASPLRLLGSDTMYDKRFLIKEAKDMIAVVPWHRHIDPSDFEKEAKELFAYEDKRNEKREPFKINWETAMGYDATQALAEGLRTASEKCRWNPLGLWDKYAQPTCLRKELKNAFSDTNNFKTDGVLGKDSVKFDRDGERNNKDDELGVLVKVCEVKNSQKEKFEFRRINECPASGN